MFEARFQTFDDSSERTKARRASPRLRAELKRRGLDGFVVPRADRQQNEYLPASEERLAWLTGFTGSAGAAIVLRRSRRAVRRRPLHRAGRRADRRRSFSPSSIWSKRRPTNGSSKISRAAPRLGYDPWLHTADDAREAEQGLRRRRRRTGGVDSNPIDALWNDRPPRRPAR